MSTDNAEIARRFVAAIERGAPPEELAAFFADDVEQHEMPNRLYEKGMRRDRAALLESARKGATVLASQRYEILRVVASGSDVAVEMTWRGVLAIPLRGLSPGDALTAHLAFFLEIEGGKIRRMRNYDCYDPF